jgi:cytochrome P450
MTEGSEEDSAGVARALVTMYMSDAGFRAAPGDFLEQLPVRHPVLDVGPVWMVSGYDEITSLLGRNCLRTSPELGPFRLPLAESATLAERFALILPMRDGDDHRRLRAITQPAFTRKRIAAMESAVERQVVRRLDAAVDRGSFEVVEDLAKPLPMDIAFDMVGVPEGERDDVAQWAIAAKESFLAAGSDVDAELAQLDEWTERSMRSPSAGTLLELLANARRDGLLSNDELLAYVLLLLVNGLDTLTSAITVAALELFRPSAVSPSAGTSHDALTRPRAHAFFDEVLRYHTPVRFSARVVAEDVDVGGERLPEGAVVLLFFAAANRDPRRFDRPSEFDPDRVPGRHLSFGHGVHKCIGRHVASLAGSIVVEQLSARRARIDPALDYDEIDWSPSLIYRTLDALPLAVRA